METTKAVTRPSRPTIEAVMDNVPPYTGVVAKDGLTNDPHPTVTGRGDAGSVIHLLVDGREVGTAVVAANGTWSFTLPQSLGDGEYRLSARASNDAGISVPSTSYGIQVDTTPPSQPKIEAATEGAQPMLSGRAEAYSKVTVYDGATVLGTTTTGVDGTWTFQLPSGLSNGTHSLTVTAMDPAGNTSVASDGIGVIVGPVAPTVPSVPTAQAILEEMGRDSGSSNFDRLTNDGTAGRLLTGRVSAALAIGEKVQVSSDGGRTWQDALMKADGTWMVIDSIAHVTNWTIQTRVVNGEGVAGALKAYDVELDTMPPDPLASATRSGNVIEVLFSGVGMSVGDMVSVMIGDSRIVYNLTAVDIASGRARVQIPADIAATMDEHTSYGAALVDRSGNISDYLVTRFVEATTSGSGSGVGIDYRIFDFNGEKPRDLGASGIPVNFGIFSVALDATITGQGIRLAGGSAVTGSIKPEAGETGLLMSTRKSTFFLNDGAHAQALAIDIGFGLVAPRNFAIDFLDDAGALVYRYLLSKEGYFVYGDKINSYHIVLPDNLQFSSFVFSKNTGGEIYLPDNNPTMVWIDNVGFSGGSFSTLLPDIAVTFNNEKPRDLGANGIPVNFGIFSVALDATITGQGIRLAGGSAVTGSIKPEAGETGLLMSTRKSTFFLNDGAHAQALAIDIGFGLVAARSFAIDFLDDAGALVYRSLLSKEGYFVYGDKIHSYHIVLPDNLQFSSFVFSINTGGLLYVPDKNPTMVWIDNVGFSGGSFTKATWETITELVPPANVQHVSDTADAAYYGAAGGSEFQVDHVSYFSGANSGIHGGAGIDTLKLTGAGQVLDLSKLLNVDGHDKLSSIEIVDITGTGNNTLKLSMSDVLTLGHEDLFRTDGHTQMMVNGNAGDRVELSGMSGSDGGHWTNQGTVAVNGMAYVVYENTALNVELLVQSAVSTQVV